MFRMIEISLKILVYLVVLEQSMVLCQYTEDCGIDYGCLKVPEGCRNTDCQYVVKWQNLGTYNKFVLMTHINFTSPYDAWTAVGFSNDMLMGDDSVVMCRLSTSTQEGKIETYYNHHNKFSDLLQRPNPSMGLFNQKIEVFDNSFFVCRFCRHKALTFSTNGYFNLTAPNKYNILIAAGRTNYLGTPSYHDTTRYANPYKQDFDSLVTAGPDPVTTSAPPTTKSPYHARTSDKKKAHSCLMIFAWIFLVSTAIIMPRYYRYLFRPQKICGAQAWLVLHVPVMIFAAIINLVSLLVILSEKNWKWIDPACTVEFVHSIFGIVSIGLLYLQIFLGLIRPKSKKDPETVSSCRKFWKFFHSIFGYSALICSIVTMFLGVVIPTMNLSRLGWGIMIGWTAWVIILPLLIEILKVTKLGTSGRGMAYQMSGTLRENYERVDKYRRIFNGIKSFYLFVHILIALGITLALIIIIGLSDEYYW